MTLKVLFKFDDKVWKDIEGLIHQDLDAELRVLVEERITDYLHWMKAGPQPWAGAKPQKRGRPPSWETGELHFLALRLYTLIRDTRLTYEWSVLLTKEVMAAVLNLKPADSTITYAVGLAVRDHREYKARWWN